MSNKIEKDNVLIDVHDLHKAFGEHQVLKGIDIQICKGELIAIIGPSGCGKSTFLRSLNLLEVPTDGIISFEGTDITDASVDIDVMREKIGMVFQQFNLFPNMTIKENIMNLTEITWRDLMQATLEFLNNRASVEQIYNILKESKKAQNNKFVREKIRQTLNNNSNFIKNGDVWCLCIEKC